MSTFNHTFRGEGFPRYGIELEVTFPWRMDKQEIAGQLVRHYGQSELFFCREERGIGNGFEIVTDPCTLDFLRTEFPWDMLWFLRTEHSAKADSDHYCGLHVHFDKAALSKAEAVKFDLFFHVQQQFIELFSRREDRNQYAWDRTIRYSRLGCSEFHNRCVSWRCENTVEVRTFNATLFHNILLASVEFVDALIRFVKLHSSMFILKKHECLEAFLDHINHYDYWHLPDYVSMLRSGVLPKEAA